MVDAVGLAVVAFKHAKGVRPWKISVENSVSLSFIDTVVPWRQDHETKGVSTCRGALSCTSIYGRPKSVLHLLEDTPCLSPSLPVFWSLRNFWWSRRCMTWNKLSKVGRNLLLFWVGHPALLCFIPGIHRCDPHRGEWRFWPRSRSGQAEA